MGDGLVQPLCPLRRAPLCGGLDRAGASGGHARRSGPCYQSPVSGRAGQIDCDVDNVATLLRLPGLMPRGMDLSPLLTEAKRQLHAEADYLTEAQNPARFGALLAGSNAFVLPALHEDLCTPQVLAMSDLESGPLDSLVDAPQAVRDWVAAALIDLVLRELFVFGAMQADPNLANYRHDPKTSRIVLLDIGAVQSIAPDLAADFRALARVALEGGEAETREAMLRIGYFGPGTVLHHQDLIQSMFNTAMAPLAAGHSVRFRPQRSSRTPARHGPGHRKRP
jgi:predicted unusual protein kinase regulating ubiquinone biosynthesis (AarF/ABC1/UbiB family)